MSAEPPGEGFEFAFGHCSVRDGELIVDRRDPESIGRIGVFREGLRANAAHRPWRTGLALGVGLLLLLVFVSLLGFLYLSNPSVWPLIVVLAVLLVLGVGIPLERSYRRSKTQRRERRARLAEEFDLVRADRIPLEAIEGVTERHVSTGRFGEGALLLVHFEKGAETATTTFGFPSMMAAERDGARAIFERQGIPITEGPGDGSSPG